MIWKPSDKVPRGRNCIDRNSGLEDKISIWGCFVGSAHSTKIDERCAHKQTWGRQKLQKVVPRSLQPWGGFHLHGSTGCQASPGGRDTSVRKMPMLINWLDVSKSEEVVRLVMNFPPHCMTWVLGKLSLSTRTNKLTKSQRDGFDRGRENNIWIEINMDAIQKGSRRERSRVSQLPTGRTGRSCDWFEEEIKDLNELSLQSENLKIPRWQSI